MIHDIIVYYPQQAKAHHVLCHITPNLVLFKAVDVFSALGYTVPKQRSQDLRHVLSNAMFYFSPSRASRALTLDDLDIALHHTPKSRIVVATHLRYALFSYVKSMLAQPYNAFEPHITPLGAEAYPVAILCRLDPVTIVKEYGKYLNREAVITLTLKSGNDVLYGDALALDDIVITSQAPVTMSNVLYVPCDRTTGELHIPANQGISTVVMPDGTRHNMPDELTQGMI